MKSLGAQIQKIPIGSSTKKINGKRYLVSRRNFNGGKSIKVYAEELGGNDFISFNYYQTSQGDNLKPCEMPEAKVIHFLESY